jgi:hypothetical protein
VDYTVSAPAPPLPSESVEFRREAEALAAFEDYCRRVEATGIGAHVSAYIDKGPLASTGPDFNRAVNI